MSTRPPPVLSALAQRFRNSKAGRSGSEGDFLADFRQLLAAAASHDGEARVRAEDDLRRAEHESAGLLTLVRHPRDPAIIHQVRLRPAGENWLFQRLGQKPPAALRRELAGFFLAAGKMPAPPVARASCPEPSHTKPETELTESATPPHPGWHDYLAGLAAKALAGGSVLPFERDDPALNAELLRVTAAVLTWPEESLIRYASAVICGDSKRLETLQPRLLQALRAITGDPSVTLESYQILQTPRAVLVHGPLVLDLPGGSLDLGLLAGPVAVSGTDLARATAIRSAARACLTVENEGVFRELAKRNPGILLVHTSFPGAATRHLLSHLPASLAFHHFGDSDPAGFDILRDLREKSGRHFQPVQMDFRPHHQAQPLTAAERQSVLRLLASPTLADVHPALQAMLDHGTKGDFEQESLGQAALRRVLEKVCRLQDCI